MTRTIVIVTSNQGDPMNHVVTFLVATAAVVTGVWVANKMGLS